MPLTTLIEKGLCAALDSPVIETLAQRAGDKAVSILKEHFTFTAYEIAKAYQDSYGYALAAITAGLSAPDNKLAFIQRFTKSKLSREFSAQIDSDYLQPFATERGVQSEALPELRQQFIEQIKTLSKQPPIFQVDNARFTEAELAAFISYKGTLAITDLVLEQLRKVAPLAETLEAFLRYDELLGNAVLFFFREIIRKDARVKTTLEALQREGLWADVRDIKTAQEESITQIQQQLDEQKAAVKQAIDAGDFSKASQITQQLQGLQQSVDDVQHRLQAAQAAWQNSQQHLIDFSQRFDTWALMLNTKVEQVLAAMETLHGTVAKIDENVETLLNEFRQFMQRFELSPQIKPSDEFTHHSSSSLKLIQAAVAKLKQLPSHNTAYNQLVIMAGSLLSSTGDIAEAEKLFLKARDMALNSAEKALACFNLFQVRLRNKDYDNALADLQTAIAIDAPRYALHDIDRYPIIRLLGAGGMGCVFLCHDQDAAEATPVVVKCFWEGRKGPRKQVFREALIMRDVAGASIPKPLNWGYVDSARQERPFFVTEYIAGAVDGETWLEKYGKLDVPTGLAVARQIAKGLQVAHEKGIFHLDLKPANLLFKQTPNGLVTVHK